MSKQNFITFLLLVSLLLSTNIYAEIKLENLQVNYQTTPLGIDLVKPRFSWKMTAVEAKRGLKQTAYQIVVVDENNRELWNTGKVNSDTSLGITYEGKKLAATTRYNWTATVWDQDGQSSQQTSWFETGLMNPDPNLSAWDGATWIGGSDEDVVLHAHYLTVFNLHYQLQLDKATKSTKAAFLFGGNDDRLMNKNLNLNGTEVGKDESYIALELDISEVDQGGNAKINIYRVGYDQKDSPDQALVSLNIPQSLINKTNKYEPHHIYMENVFGIINLFVDGQMEEHKMEVPQIQGWAFTEQGLNLNPYGAGGDFICYPVLGDIGFRLPAGQKASFSNLEIRHYRKPSNLIFSEELDAKYSGTEDHLSVNNQSYQLTGGKAGFMLLANPSKNAAPMLRTAFSVDSKKVKKARIYATARGIYELHLNGKRVGDDYFNPGLTQYNKTHLYQTYDVTNLINAGEANALGAWLSEGWWSGNITFRGENWNFFGDRQSLLAKLVITYTDGTETVITSNPNDWQLYTDGPIRYGSFFQGEVYDANKEAAIAGWSTAQYDPEDWKPATEVSLKDNSLVGTFINFFGTLVTLNYDDQQIVGQIGENVSIVKTMTAKSVEEVRPGVFVYDMGQNMVGVPKISIKNGEKGQTIRMRFAEVRYPDLDQYAGNSGMIMLENIRAALTQDLYILKGGDEVIQPRFTFHGYRFIEVTGVEEALPLEAVQGQVLSSVSGLSSQYETSNELVNQLWQNITWSLRGNFLSIPTDTPARNERMGWNGDLNVFSRASTWLTDANQFLKRHLRAMRDMQTENGRFSDVAPVGNGFGGTLWGSAGIVVPWEAYQQYGDVSLLAEHYGAMKAYVDFLRSKQNEDGVLNEGPLGDWLSPENNKNDNTLLWTAYQVYNLEIMQKVATILGKTEDAQDFQKRYEQRKAFFNKTYVNPETMKTVKSGANVPTFGAPPSTPPKKGDVVDTQASYAIPLAFGVFDEKYKAAMAEQLAKTVTRKNTDDTGAERPEFSLMTGFIGTAAIGDALSKNGYSDLAYGLLQSETYPSWLYPVKNGATTIWERLNSYTIEDGFGGNNSMNSFNHYAFGAIASWMYNFSLGIQRSPEHPGFKHFELKPTPDPTGKMAYAKGYYDSMYGRIVSEWHQEDEGTRYVITVPANTTAALYLIADSVKKVREGDKAAKKGKGIKYVGKEEGRVVFELVSGRYEFFVKE